MIGYTRTARTSMAAVAGALLASMLLTGCAKHLSANSSCRDFLNASASEQDSAVNKIAADLHAGNAVTPLGRPNISYLCANAPDMTLGTAIQRTG
jgi:hypothetical protein